VKILGSLRHGYDGASIKDLLDRFEKSALIFSMPLPISIRDHQQNRSDGANEAWLVTTSGFSKGAKRFAKGKPMRLITIKEILSGSEVTSPSRTG
jgi:Restriction endonuclease